MRYCSRLQDRQDNFTGDRLFKWVGVTQHTPQNVVFKGALRQTRDSWDSTVEWRGAEWSTLLAVLDKSGGLGSPVMALLKTWALWHDWLPIIVDMFLSLLFLLTPVVISKDYLEVFDNHGVYSKEAPVSLLKQTQPRISRLCSIQILHMYEVPFNPQIFHC